MKCQIHHFLSFVVLALLCSCASVTMTQFLADGKTPLSSTQLHELLAEHSLHLEAIDFDAKVVYLPNGQLTATSHLGAKDKGKWSISAKDELCMKFDIWYFGDQRCYKLFNENDKYIFFSANGARYYTGTMSPPKGGDASNQPQSESNNLIGQGQNVATALPDRNNPSPVPQLSKSEREHILINLARNCPDCNFAGVDLRGAQLVAANLPGANLSGADLHDANLRRANLAGANLSGTNLTGSNLAGANLTDCDLSNADLTDSNLIRATVTGAELKGAILTGAHLENIQGLKK
jgi:hypothetical protein